LKQATLEKEGWIFPVLRTAEVQEEGTEVGKDE